MRFAPLLLLPAASCHVIAHGATRPLLVRTTTPAMLLTPDAAPPLDAGSLLVANAAAEQVGPALLAQMSVVGGLVGGGFFLEFFGDVDEPKEVGVEEGTSDIYRDSPLRYLGYANECGEAFRPLVPVEVVYVSYALAIGYILADTVDKGRKGAASATDNAILRATFGATDTFLWQMLASVLFPSFCINRLVALLGGLQEAGSVPDLLTASWLPTVAGLALIPLVIVPLDVLAHWVRLPPSPTALVPRRSPASRRSPLAGAQRLVPSREHRCARLRRGGDLLRARRRARRRAASPRCSQVAAHQAAQRRSARAAKRSDS